MNVYYADRAHVANHVVSIWIDRRLFRNPASIKKDLVEAWDVDCRQRRFRRVLRFDPSEQPAVAAASTWNAPGPGTPHEQLLRLVCADIYPHELP